MLRKTSLLSFWIATLLLFLFCCTVMAAQPTKKGPKRFAKGHLPQPRFSLLSSCRLDQQFLELTQPPPAVSEASPTKQRSRTTILPFVGKDPNLAIPALPERPAIAAADPLIMPLEQVVAGFTYCQDNRFFFNLGYSLPTTPLQEYAQPFGFSLTDEADVKQISIGIDIAF